MCHQLPKALTCYYATEVSFTALTLLFSLISIQITILLLLLTEIGNQLLSKYFSILVQINHGQKMSIQTESLHTDLYRTYYVMHRHFKPFHRVLIVRYQSTHRGQ